MDLPLLHLLRQMQMTPRIGLRSRQSRNQRLRASGTEPFPNVTTAGVKRMARFLKRQGVAPVHIKNPRDYLNSKQRRAYDAKQHSPR
jgi:hypothetical protein